MPDREGNFARREFLTPLDAWSLANDDEVIGFDVGNLLGQPIRPADSQIDGLAVAEAQVQAPVVRRIEARLRAGGHRKRITRSMKLCKWRAEPSARWSLGSGKISTVCTKSEALVIHFSDGSIIGIDTGSNART